MINSNRSSSTLGAGRLLTVSRFDIHPTTETLIYALHVKALKRDHVYLTPKDHMRHLQRHSLGGRFVAHARGEQKDDNRMCLSSPGELAQPTQYFIPGLGRPGEPYILQSSLYSRGNFLRVGCMTYVVHVSNIRFLCIRPRLSKDPTMLATTEGHTPF